MTSTVFYKIGDKISGFSLSGHTDNTGSEQAKLVCAAVSSAAYMTANTVTDVLGLTAEISVNDGEMSLRLSAEDCSAAQTVLEGFRLHITELKNQYNQYIAIKTEVQHDA